MNRFQRITAVFLAVLLAQPSGPLMAKTRKGERLRAEARVEEVKGNLDRALELAEQAAAEDASDPSYLLLLRRVRFECAGAHVKAGQKMRAAGKVEEALAEFEKAYGVDPASDVAEQEIRRTKEMIERNKSGAAGPGTASLTPSEVARKESQERTELLQPLPELRPFNGDLINLKMSNKPRVLFETVCKVGGVNVLFDPEYAQQQTLQQAQIDLTNTTLDAALDQLAVVTKSFWKPVSQNTIFVTVDNPTKRREYAEQVVKVFYLSNITGPQEMQELLTVLRTVVDVQKVFNYTAQNVLVVRAEADTMALVEKLISDLDKPKSEVIVDVVVMQVSSTYMRKLTAAFAPNGITTAANYTPRSTLTTGTTSSSSTTTTTTASTAVPLSKLGRLSTADYSLASLPGAQFEAVLSDSGTRVLQSPQIRATDKIKASIKIGDKVPTATGSFQPGVAGVGVNSLVNTQFTFLDVGVNVEITPYVHDSNSVSLHVDLDVSQVKDRIDLGGVSEPEISQNKALVDIRMRDGEVNLIGGIIQQTDSKSKSGIPGLGSIPGLGRLFSGENIEKDRTELVIALIPHILRAPDVTGNNLKGVAAGNAQQIKVSYAPRKSAAKNPNDGTASVPVASPVPPPVTAPVTPAVTAPVATQPVQAVPPAPTPQAVPPVPDAPPPPRPAGPPGLARITFQPPNALDLNLSQIKTVTIYAENVNEMTQVSASLQFDPKIIRVFNVTPGDLLERTGKGGQMLKNILNDTGIVQAGLPVADGNPVSGAGALFQVSLQAVGRGETLLTPITVMLNSANGPIPATRPSAVVVNVK
jgi:general secretion pathway protein D